MNERIGSVRALLAALIGVLFLAWSPAADAQSTRCEIPRAARDIWRCERGFVIGPENVIIRLPIPETDPEALYNAGIEAAGREDWRVAIAYFTAAHQRAHLVPRYMYNLGLAHARAANEVAAIAWLSTYLIAEPDASNRREIWGQIRQLESAATRRASLFWDQASTAVRSSTSGMSSVDGAAVRTTAYGSLASAAARAGDLTRARQFYGLQFMEENANQQPTDAQFVSSGRIGDAISAALTDYDLASAEGFMAQLPPEQGRVLQLYESDRSRLNTGWPLIDEPAVFTSIYRSYAYSMSLSWQAEGIRARAAPPASDPEAQSPRRLIGYPFLGRGPEAIAGLQRLASGDWSGEPLDVQLREDDDSMRMMSDQDVRWDRARDDLFRYYTLETTAALVGEASLIVGDMRSASEAARIARVAVDRGLRESARINRDGIHGISRFPDFFRTEEVLGYGAARIEALMAAETGDVDGAVNLLTAFLSRRYKWQLARPDARTDISAESVVFEPNMDWFEARHLSEYTIAQFLVRRDRSQDAARVAETLDSLRRAIIEASLPPFPPVGEQRRIEDAIIVARTLGGASSDISAYLAAVQAIENPNWQLQLIAWGAEDLTRGVRRARAAYTLAGGTWGQ